MGERGTEFSVYRDRGVAGVVGDGAVVRAFAVVAASASAGVLGPGDGNDGG